MFSKLALRKNNYLNHYYHKVDPSLVDKIFCDVADETSRNILDEVHNLCSPNEEIYWNSVKTLKKLLLDPKFFRQVLASGIVVTLAVIWAQAADSRVEIYSILKIIACRFQGALEICKNTLIVENLLKQISSRTEQHVVSLEILNEMSNHPTVAQELNKNYQEIHQIMKKTLKDDILDFPSLYNLVTNLVANQDDLKTEEYFRPMFKKLINSRENLPEKLKCMGVLVNSELGQKFADGNFLVDLLLCLLNNPKLDETSQENTIFCLKNCLISHYGMMRFERHWETITPILIKKASSKFNLLMQLYAFEALHLISRDPIIKEYLKATSNKIKSIFCLSTEAITLKKNLLLSFEQKIL